MLANAPDQSSVAPAVGVLGAVSAATTWVVIANLLSLPVTMRGTAALARDM